MNHYFFKWFFTRKFQTLKNHSTYPEKDYIIPCYECTCWEVSLEVDYTIYDISGSSADHVLAIASDKILRTNGGSWEEIPLPTNGLGSIWVTSDENTYVFGARGRIMHRCGPFD